MEAIKLYENISNHMKRVRGITLKSLEKIPEDLADHIPNTYKNNIRWNFGHIIVVQEKLVFGVMNEKLQIPTTFIEYFKPGTSPNDWNGTPPSFNELAKELTLQIDRIDNYAPYHLDEALPTPFINSSKMQFDTFSETLLFSFYHEALHMETIKRIYRLVK